MSNRRIGLIVPSSNTTMETEVPELLARRPGDDRFTFHSSRAVLHTVDADSLRAMADQAERCAAEVADAAVDAVAYACLIAVMAQGPRAHEDAERRLRDAAGGGTPVTSSAGALVRGVQRLGLSRIAIVAPYAPELTDMVVRYFAAYGIEVTAVRSLSVTDNREVGRLDPSAPLEHARGLDLDDAQGVVLSACVQMPSLAAVTQAQDTLGLPVFSAATATTRELLDALGLEPRVPGGGALLDGPLPDGALPGVRS